MKPLSLSVPRVIFVSGIPGAGKTRFAEKFAETFCAPFVHDAQLRSLLQLDSAAQVDTLSLHILGELLKTQKTVVVETNTSLKRQRQSLTKFVKSHGYEPMFVWIQTDEATARQRRSRGIGALSDDQFAAAVKKFTPFSSDEEPVVVSGKHTYATQARTVLRRLAEPRIAEETTPQIVSRQAAPLPSRPSTSIKIS